MQRLHFYDREERPWVSDRLTTASIVGHTTDTSVYPSLRSACRRSRRPRAASFEHRGLGCSTVQRYRDLIQPVFSGNNFGMLHVRPGTPEPTLSFVLFGNAASGDGVVKKPALIL